MQRACPHQLRRALPTSSKRPGSSPATPTPPTAVACVATARGTNLFARRERAGNAWLAEHLGALSERDRLALERAVALLETMAAERPDGLPVLSEERPMAKEETKMPV